MIHWKIREVQGVMHNEAPAALDVLINLFSHANIRLRCWPSVKTIHEEIGWGNDQISEAKKWLVEHEAIYVVHVHNRQFEEKKLPSKLHVYQLTGYIKFGDRRIPYLHLSDEQMASIQIEVSLLGSLPPAKIPGGGTSGPNPDSSNIPPAGIEGEIPPAGIKGIPGIPGNPGSPESGQPGLPEVKPSTAKTPKVTEPSPETKLKNRFAMGCYGTLDIFKPIETSKGEKKASPKLTGLQKSLREMKQLTPDMTDATLDVYFKDYEPTLYRSKMGAIKPLPHQVNSEWLRFRDWCRANNRAAPGMLDPQQTEASRLVQHPVYPYMTTQAEVDKYYRNQETMAQLQRQKEQERAKRSLATAAARLEPGSR